MSNSLFLDQKYINLLASSLLRFRRQDEDIFNFRCPICGDSHKSKYKARGYFYAKNDRMMMMCHNCNASMPFYKFLEIQDPNLYREYRTEAFLEFGKSKGRIYRGNPEDFFGEVDVEEEETEAEEKVSPPPRLNLQSIDELSSEHYARRYVANRKIPKDKWGIIYFSPVFSLSIGEIFPTYYSISRHRELLKHKEPRLVLPYYDRDGTLIGLNGRSFGGEGEKKYIIAKAYEEAPKFYGLDRADPSKNVYVMEGPIDSLFIENAIASMDSTLSAPRDFLYKVLVPDNQPRNLGVCRSIKKMIDDGESIVLWPSEITQKDINEMIMDGGMSPSEIMYVIDRNTFKGLSAQLEFSRWQKIK